MKFSKKLQLITVLSAMLTGSMSCSNWLDVGAKDRIMENTLFASPEGFISALNGVYIDMLGLYGGILTTGTFDVMAQYFDCDKENHAYQKIIQYDQNAKNGKVSGLWSKAYFLINNANTIAERCDENRSVLNNEYYHVIKGEALAIRALLHFELLKVFGPVYSVNPDKVSIPYAENSALVMRPLLPASEVGQFILRDLKAAEQLLEGFDPVIESGTLFSSLGAGTPNDMRYRSMRLNYYAVQALIARVALYVGDKTTALTYAEKVIQGTQVDHKWFPFVSKAAVSTASSEDRIYQSEILFGAYHSERTKAIYDGFYSNKLTSSNVLRMNEEKRKEMYGDAAEKDYRFLYQWLLLKAADEDGKDGEQLVHFVKFMDVNDANNADKISQGYRYIIPVLRISEMYLIAAECQPDPIKGMKYLNDLRAARGIFELPAESGLMIEIEKEYRKEFIGEGQLFWFYKRVHKQEIPAGSKTGKIQMMDNYYLFDLPKEETDNRGEAKKEI